MFCLLETFMEEKAGEKSVLTSHWYVRLTTDLDFSKKYVLLYKYIYVYMLWLWLRIKIVYSSDYCPLH